MSAHKSSYSQPQRLRATIFEIADGVQRRNAATAEGRCPILTAFTTNSRRTAVTFRTCVGERNISSARFAFNPLARRSVGIRLTASVKTAKVKTRPHCHRPHCQAHAGRYRRSHYSAGMNGAGSGPTKHLSGFCREYLRSRLLTPNDRSPRFKLLPTHSTKLALALSLAEDLRWGSGSDREVIAYSRNRSKILQAPADRLGNTVQIAINFR